MMQSESESESDSTVTIDGVDSDAVAARATLFWCFFVPLWRSRALYVDEACIAQLAVVFIASAVGKTFDKEPYVASLSGWPIGPIHDNSWGRSVLGSGI
jgi:hypothetical protein